MYWTRRALQNPKSWYCKKTSLSSLSKPGIPNQCTSILIYSNRREHWILLVVIKKRDGRPLPATCEGARDTVNLVVADSLHGRRPPDAYLKYGVVKHFAAHYQSPVLIADVPPSFSLKLILKGSDPKGQLFMRRLDMLFCSYCTSESREGRGTRSSESKHE